MNKLEETTARIAPLDEAAMAAARARQDNLTKPRGSLGRLEELSIQMAGIQGRAVLRVVDKTIITMAGDHGVVRDGVSAYPAEVTPQMALNFLAGGAGINALARHVGARVVVVDVGVAVGLRTHPQLVARKAGYGTLGLLAGPDSPLGPLGLEPDRDERQGGNPCQNQGSRQGPESSTGDHERVYLSPRSSYGVFYHQARPYRPCQKGSKMPSTGSDGVAGLSCVGLSYSPVPWGAPGWLLGRKVQHCSRRDAWWLLWRGF